MRTFVTTLFQGIRITFVEKKYRILFAGVFAAFAALFVFIPVWTVAGNTLATELDLLTASNIAVMLFISALYALFATMQVYVMRRRRTTRGVGTVAGAGAGTLFAGIAGSAFCASCLAPLFAFFGIGFGGVLVVLEYRFYIVAVTALLMLLAIYFTARKIQNACATCV